MLSKAYQELSVIDIQREVSGGKHSKASYQQVQTHQQLILGSRVLDSPEAIVQMCLVESATSSHWESRRNSEDTVYECLHIRCPAWQWKINI